MKQVCVVGGISSGKSYICKLFEKNDIPVFYFDIEAKKLYEDEKILRNVKELFGISGDDIIKKLAKIVFSDSTKRRQLESLLKPDLMKAYYEACYKYEWIENRPIFICECATMMKSNDYKHFDEIILVHADVDKREQMAIKRGMNINDFYSRVAAQMSTVETLEILKKNNIKYVDFKNDFDDKSENFVLEYLK